MSDSSDSLETQLNALEDATECEAVCIPAKEVSSFTASVKQSLLKIRGMRPVVPLKEHLQQCIDSLPREIVESPDQYRLVIFSPGTQTPQTDYHRVPSFVVQRGYSEMKADEVLRRLLPPHVTCPSAFETVGHIAHFNLREEHEPFKRLIGRVILDKNPAIKTVVTKTANLSNTFRTPQIEVIGGTADLVAKVKESRMTFEVDFSKVYWNSRLSTERRRLLAQLSAADDWVVDMCAGVGAFVCMAAKIRQCGRVYANDLNPDGAQAIRRNAEINGVADRLRVYNLDAREFVRHIKSELSECKGNVHFLMNLPEISIEFLDVFRGLFHETGNSPTDFERKFLIHTHCFARSEPPGTEIIPRVCKALQEGDFDSTLLKIAEAPVSIHEVRDVAPNKRMYCVEFYMPVSVLTTQSASGEPGSPTAPNAKRVKTG